MASAEQGGLIFLVDNEWRPEEEGQNPPITAMLGAWRVSADGFRGRFQPNPLYLPSTPDSPPDPVDAVLRKLASGEFDPEHLPEVLAEVRYGIALDERGVAVVRPAPDGTPAVLVTTAYAHRDRVDAARWRDVTLVQLADALPATGVHVLVNPGAPHSLLVLADSIRKAAADHAVLR
ncbi:type VII secretion system-associated protein [Actinokineospora guangxiensis]|uniref:Type VII secretion system-associated protein n=1 Tax=Actinokineospora guangxiensis TaxID=1490288 RepID=A0ABW0EPC7_9PSEU